MTAPPVIFTCDRCHVTEGIVTDGTRLVWCAYGPDGSHTCECGYRLCWHRLVLARAST
jgi:hypothetical protein